MRGLANPGCDWIRPLACVEAGSYRWVSDGYVLNYSTGEKCDLIDASTVVRAGCISTTLVWSGDSSAR